MLHPSFWRPAMNGSKWNFAFRHLLFQFQHELIDEAQFKDKLAKSLGFPQGYIDWLVFMCTREQSTP